MSPSSPRPQPWRGRPSVPRRQSGRRADGGQRRGAQGADRYRRPGPPGRAAGFLRQHRARRCRSRCLRRPRPDGRHRGGRVPPAAARRDGKATVVQRGAGAGISRRAHRRPAPRRWPPWWRCATAIRRKPASSPPQAEEARVSSQPASPRRGHSTICATPTTCWRPASRSSPRPASISGSRRSGCCCWNFIRMKRPRDLFWRRATMQVADGPDGERLPADDLPADGERGRRH